MCVCNSPRNLSMLIMQYSKSGEPTAQSDSLFFKQRVFPERLLLLQNSGTEKPRMVDKYTGETPQMLTSIHVVGVA